MKQGILLCSGGIDSTVMAYWLKTFCPPACLFFCDYGQASADHQAELVAFHAEQLGAPFRREKFDWPDYARGKGYIFDKGRYPEGLTDPYCALKMTPEEYDTYLEEQWDFIQGRNIAFLARAGAYALHLGLDRLYTAFQFDQPEWDAGIGDSDTSPQFVEAFNALSAAGGFSKPIEVVAPFLALRRTKQQITAIGRKLGVPMEKTYSCEFYPECGECHQCLIRADVLATK